jgi:hypothetical protein
LENAGKSLGMIDRAGEVKGEAVMPLTSFPLVQGRRARHKKGGS